MAASRNEDLVSDTVVTLLTAIGEQAKDAGPEQLHQLAQSFALVASNDARYLAEKSGGGREYVTR